MTDKQQPDLLALVGRLWNHDLALDPYRALARFDALVAEHGTDAVGAALIAVRRSQLPDTAPS